MYTLGIDIGSASSKAVILKDGNEIAASAVIQFGTGTSGPWKVLEEVFDIASLKKEDIIYTVSTGYGRFSVKGADKQVSEITCHAKGVHYRLLMSITRVFFAVFQSGVKRVTSKRDMGNTKCLTK